VKLYFAGPLFTTPERTWNAEVTAALRAAGHEIFLPQEQEPGKDGPGIFATDVGGIDWADGLVAIMDGPDPDSGTAWEVGYAFGTRKPVVLVRNRLSGAGRLGRRVQPDADAGRHGPDRPPRGLDHRGHRRDPRGARADRSGRELS
jgi:nucleoside 2-deoxyribosyltransferase